jgi:hypothetical protein
MLRYGFWRAEKMHITIQATTWNVDNDCLFEVSSNDGEVLAIVDGLEVQDIVSWGFVHEGQVLSLEV